jgi:hypothetical protein
MTDRGGSDSHPHSRSGWAWVVGILGGLIVFALFGYFVWLPSQLGDPAPEYVVVTNSTDDHLTIVAVARDGSTATIGEVGPHSSAETWAPCGASELNAYDPDGELVAVRPAADRCDLDWTVAP